MASKIQKLDCSKETEEVVEESEGGNWDGLPPELLNMIFNRLPTADLFSCSVVSKTWKKVSRDVLKRTRECYAYIKHLPEDVYDLIDKIDSTDLMQILNGLHIQMRPKDKENPVPSSSTSSSSPFWRQEFSCSETNNGDKWKEARRKLVNVALSGQMRYLTLDLEDKWDQDLFLDDLVLLRELISETSESLQKLVIWQDEGCDLMNSCGKNFAKLKVVQVQCKNIILEDSFLNEFLPEFAPNLDEITGGMLVLTLNHQENPFLLKRSKNLTVFHYEKFPGIFLEHYRAISGLHRLDLRACHCDSLGDDNILFSMLLKSLNTLEELRMYNLEFYNLFKTSAQLRFSNLRRLCWVTNWNMPVRNDIAILKQLNLPKLCPNLEQFEICTDHSDQTDYAYKEEDWTPATLPYGADQSDMPMQIAFEYRGIQYSHEYFEFLNEIYPKINKVCMLTWELGDPIDEMSRIFSDICSLEYLEIRPAYCRPHPLDFQMDALLCGISSGEVQFLFNSSPRTDNADLNPCIVPIRPSLFNAKNLKELKITGQPSSSEAVVNRSWVVQVTENLPARHLRHLEVIFEGTEDLYNRLNRLQAFRTLLCAQVET